MIAPDDESRDIVMRWIEEAGLSSYAYLSPGSDNVILEASISQIENLLNAEYSSFGKLLRSCRPLSFRLASNLLIS